MCSLCLNVKINFSKWGLGSYETTEQSAQMKLHHTSFLTSPPLLNITDICQTTPRSLGVIHELAVLKAILAFGEQVGSCVVM